MTSTAQQQSSVSKTESMVLIKNMIRISISSICYFRDIFPGDCYKNKQYGAVNIHQLQGAHKDADGELVVKNKEAFLLTQWLERGIFAALEEEYLSSMLFAIYTQHPTTKADLLLETYEFKVSYGGPNKPAKVNNADLHSKEAVKTQAAKFIRSLTEFASTLDDLPAKRWLTVQLKYQDNTPADYEPEFFGPSAASLLTGLRLPLVVNVGQLETAELDLKIKFAGMESLLFEDLCKVDQRAAQKQEPAPPAAAAAAPAPVPAPAPAAFCGKTYGNDNQATNDNASTLFSELADPTSLLERLEEEAKQPLHADISEDFKRMDVAEQPQQQSLEETVAPPEAPRDAYERVKAFIVEEKGRPVISKCAAQLGIGMVQVKQAFQDLVKDGFLRSSRGSYTLTAKCTVVSLDVPSSEQQLRDTTPTVMEEEVQAVGEMEKPAARAQLTFAKEVPSNKDSASTTARPSLASKNLDMSQSSDAELGKGKRRKLSVVREPIHVEGGHGIKKKRTT